MRGTTLTELLLVLVLLTAGVSGLVPGMRRLGEQLRVRAAGEALVAALSEARADAVRAGGATIVIAASPPAYRIDRPYRVGGWTTLQAEGVTLRIDAGRDSIAIDFDRLGLARLASHTIRLEAGEATRTVVVSSYGRVRRR